MTERELPAGDDVTAPWWAATAERRLLLQRCACGRVQHPPRAVCLACGRMDGLGWVEAAGRGIVDSWTAVHRAPRPDEQVPYTIARVRLAEGPIVLTRLVGADPEGWRSGEGVVLDWLPGTEGRALPVFRREEA